MKIDELLHKRGNVTREVAYATTHNLESASEPMRDLGKAVQDAANPEALAPNSNTLRATILLLNALTLEEVELKHSQRRRWEKNFSAFQAFLNQLEAMLVAQNWMCRTL